MITNDDRAEAIQAAANEIANVQTGQPKGSKNLQWREFEAEGQAVVDRLQALFGPDCDDVAVSYATLAERAKMQAQQNASHLAATMALSAKLNHD